MPEYRKAIGGVVWHFHFDCTTWPISDFIASENPPELEICWECTSLHAFRVKTCPVIINQKQCGLELLRNSDGFYYCPLGHRTLLVE